MTNNPFLDTLYFQPTPELPGFFVMDANPGYNAEFHTRAMAANVSEADETTIDRSAAPLRERFARGSKLLVAYLVENPGYDDPAAGDILITPDDNMAYLETLRYRTPEIGAGLEYAALGTAMGKLSGVRIVEKGIITQETNGPLSNIAPTLDESNQHVPLDGTESLLDLLTRPEGCPPNVALQSLAARYEWLRSCRQVSGGSV